MRADGVQWMVRGAGFALGAGAILVVAQLGSRALGVVLIVFVGVLLAAALEPLVTRIRRRLPLSRGQAIGAVYLGFFIAVVGVALVIVPTAAAEASRIADRVPALLDQAATWAATLQPEMLGAAAAGLVGAAQAALERTTAPPDTGAIVQAGLTLAEAVASLATLLVVVAFWLVERPHLQRYVLAFAPASRRAGGRIAWNRVERRLGLWVRGQLVLMSVVGVAAAAVYQLLGLPSALLLGLIAGLCEVIPLVGPLIGAVPALLVAMTISPTTALATAAAYVVIQVVEGNVLVPMVMRNAIGISPLLVLLSILVGAAVGGLVGALVAVPLVAAIEVLLEPLQARDVPVATDSRPDEPRAEELRAEELRLPPGAEPQGQS